MDEFDGEALKVVGGLGEVVGVAWLERECGEGCGLVGAASALLTSA